MAPRIKQGLADLRPNALIHCFWCHQPKPQSGSVRFRAHLVCAECADKLRKEKP